MSTLTSNYKGFITGIVLVGSSLAISNSALAGTFPCSNDCQTISPKVAQIQGKRSIDWDRDTASLPFLKELHLTAEQHQALSVLVDKQMPSIYANINSLENGRSLLREMALSKKYDESIAQIAADRIASSSAALAVLQAEREYQIFVLLTPEQAKKFEKMRAAGEIKLM